jgi:predicted RNase H-like nuclease
MDGLRLIGVDGCRSGWVVCASDQSLTAPEFGIAPSFAELLAALEEVRALIAIDIPIGLPSGAPVDTGVRRVDSAAREFLGGRRRASVFSAPCRPTLAATSYREACDLEAEARGRGKGLSQQAYNIIPKIREVDLAITPEHQSKVDDTARVWVREAHPEVSFAALDGRGQPGHGLVHSKRNCTSCRGRACPGESDRVALLRNYLPDFDPRAVHERLVKRYPRAAGQTGALVGRDDIVDAAACLVTAYRIAKGQAVTLPDGDAQTDERGLRMEIIA